MNIVRKVWKICGKEYCEKSVENMWKTITWENCGKFVKKIVWKNMWKICEKNSVEKYVEKNSVGKCGKQ
jgi:hypothetical protein